KAIHAMVAEGFTQTLDTKNAITFAPPENSITWQDTITVQLIKPLANRFGSVYDVLDGFDFNVAQAAVEVFDKLGNHYVVEAVCSDAFNVGERGLKLKIVNISNPIVTMQRCMKYAARGYTIPNYELMKIISKWEDAQNDKQEQFKKL